ncbi:Phenylalanine--tRNA ligase beta subunit [Bienertia sinuspersici]
MSLTGSSKRLEFMLVKTRLLPWLVRMVYILMSFVTFMKQYY